MAEHLVFSVECRASADGPMLHGVVLQEGRAATGGRAEVFAPLSTDWPAASIAIMTEHRGTVETRAVPERADNGEIRIAAKATPTIFQAVNAGKRYMSVGFHAQEAVRTRGGVREIRRALITGAALTNDPEYEQTAAEVRTRKARRVWL